MKRRLANGHTLGGGESNQSGYTITELLIVIAVTGAMFAGIVTAFSGRQARAQFTQSVREIEASMQKVISDTEKSNSGLDGVSCTWANISNGPVISSDAGASSDGQCTFGGKVLTLGDDGRFQVSNMLIRRDDKTGQKLNPEQVALIGDSDTMIPVGIQYLARVEQGSYFIGQTDRVSIRKVVSLIDNATNLKNILVTKYLSTDITSVEPGIWLPFLTGNLFSDSGRVSEDFQTNPSQYLTINGYADLYYTGAVICLGESGSGGRKASITLSPSGSSMSASMVTEIDIKPGPGDPCYG
ncbi:type II secretion system protein [Candidatus Saccharibacteria bacterium]|nr:type II secretion system protein [Candidatus Saccharibacteria bacterium]